MIRAVLGLAVHVTTYVADRNIRPAEVLPDRPCFHCDPGIVVGPGPKPAMGADDGIIVGPPADDTCLPLADLLRRPGIADRGCPVGGRQTRPKP